MYPIIGLLLTVVILYAFCVFLLYRENYALILFRFFGTVDCYDGISETVLRRKSSAENCAWIS